jgi:hypothetical protein
MIRETKGEKDAAAECGEGKLGMNPREDTPDRERMEERLYTFKDVMRQKRRIEFIEAESPGLLGCGIDAEESPACDGCVYFSATCDYFGDCKRYPKSILVNGAGWCGGVLWGFPVGWAGFGKP